MANMLDFSDLIPKQASPAQPQAAAKADPNRGAWDKVKDFAGGIGQSFKDTPLGAMQFGLDVADKFGVKEIGGLPVSDLRAGAVDVAANEAEKKRILKAQGRDAFGYGEIAGDVLQTLPLPAGAGSLGKMAVAGGASGALYGGTRPEDELKTANDALLSRGGEALKSGVIGAVAAPVVGAAVGTVSRAAPKIGQLLRDESGAVGRNLINTSAGKAAVGVAKQLGLNADELGDDVINAFGKYTSQGFKPTQALDKAIADKYAVRLSRGDITRNVIQQGEEDLALKGAYGQQAKDLAESFRTGQNEDLYKGGANLIRDISGRELGLADELGQEVAGGIKSQARASKEAATAAYDAARQGRAYITNPSEQLTSLAQRAKQSLSDFDVDLMPRVQKRISEIEDYAAQLGASKATGFSLNSMEKLRQRVNKGIEITGDKAERAALQKLKSTYDEFIEETIDNGLIKGDEKVLQKLKDARMLWADYRKTFTEDKIINKIVTEDLTPESTLQLLTGAGKLGASKESATIVNKIKNVLGEASPEYGAFKQAALQKLFGDNWKSYIYGDLKGFSGNQFVKNLKELETANPTLLKSIFTPTEYGELKAFGRVASTATERVKGAVNYSNTTPALLRWFNSLGNTLPGGNLVTGAITKTIKGAQNAAKNLDFEGAFSGKLSLNDRYPVNKFAAGLGAKTGVVSGEKAAISATEGLSDVKAKPQKYPTKVTIPAPKQQSYNITTPEPSGATLAAIPENPARSQSAENRGNGGGVQPVISKDIQQAEGYRPAVYRDSLGIKTIGIGFNMESPNAKKVWEQAGIQTSFDDAINGRAKLSEDEINQLANTSYQIAENDAKSLVKGFDDLSDNRKAAVLQLSYQLGGPRLSGFKTTLAALNAGNYQAAAKQLLNSKLAKQTPERALKIARMLANDASYDDA